jgi:hypothetical protein
MRKVLALALLTALAAPAPAPALELKNARAAYGLLSAPRESSKFLPGDIITLIYDIEDLKVNPKTGVAQVQQTLEILDVDGKVIFGQKPRPIEVPLFGATQMPGIVQALMTTDQNPGKYKLKVTVEDKVAKESKKLEYKFELAKPAFGIVQPFTPAVAFLNQDFVVTFAVTGMKRDPKTRLPDVDISTKLLGKNGKPLVETPIKNNIQDLHVEGTEFDLTMMTVVPVSLHLVLSQKGHFTIDIEATDRLTKKKVVMQLPLTVIDPSPFLSKVGAASAE